MLRREAKCGVGGGQFAAFARGQASEDAVITVADELNSVPYDDQEEMTVATE